MPYILSLDQGTTSSRAILFDKEGKIRCIAQKEFRQIFPQPGWVEHDPSEIWSSQISVAAEAIAKAGITAKEVAAIGITNQRETTIVWEKATGRPVHNAIVWQDRRTADYCDSIRATHAENIRQKTGLIIDAYFSATKIKWILENVAGAKEKAARGELLFGTVDSWLIWNLTGGAVHATDVTNASRTMLYNIQTLEWDAELLELFQIPMPMLPRVQDSSSFFGETAGNIFAHRIPVTGVAGDQQAALFGQLCTQPGMVKNTYGTGCFMLMNIGAKPVLSQNNLITTIAWKIENDVQYALEGSIFIGGAVVQWLRDGLQLITHAPEVEQLALQADDNGGVFFVPAFAGLGAPHWNGAARGTITGITRGTTKAHLARAALESIVLQTRDVLKAMERDAGTRISELRVDGGAASNDLLMQLQADVLQAQVIRPVVTEVTALGAAYLAGLGMGFWKSLDDLQHQWTIERRFLPQTSHNTEALIKGWDNAVKTAMYAASLT